VSNRGSYFMTLRLLLGLWQESDIGQDGWIDLGGGFPLIHDNSGAEPFSVDEHFFTELGEAWGENRPLLIIEPGRIIAGPSMSLVGTVLAHKKRPREPQIVVIDAGTNHNVMGAFYEHAWSFDRTIETQGSYRICGPLCMEDDLMSGERKGSVPQIGSLAVMKNAGAYSLALARSFIQPIPPVVQLNGGRYKVIQRRGVFGWEGSTQGGWHD
jgi:diaminopimelate decarboxylase